MAKVKTQFVCSSCGGTAAKLMGRCPHCGEWNTMAEEVIADTSGKATNNRFQGITKGSAKVENLDSVETKEYDRTSTHIGELDRVLGGGLVDGGVVLIGGDPGIGKSTLLLQAIVNLSKNNKTLYVSGEESSEQIALRGRRLQLPLANVRIYSEIELEKIQRAIEA